MNRYTEWLKKKVMCDVCKREISRGHINNHFKSKIHRKNLSAKEEVDNIKNDKDSITITF